MRKLLISLFIISTLLLSAIGFVGEMAENNIRRLFSEAQRQGLAVQLLSYEKHFLSARVSSRMTLQLEQQRPIVLTLLSSIRHYPHQAQINNQISLLDAQLARQVQDYFGTENWLSSQQQISLLGRLSGQLQLLPGGYYQGAKQFATKALQLHYQLDLQDYAAKVNVHWQGFNALSKESYVSVDSLRFRSTFTPLASAGEYDYIAEVAEVIIQQSSSHTQLQGMAAQGSMRRGSRANTLDSDNDWQVALYQLDNDPQKAFTDNHLKLNLNGLSLPALSRLSAAGAETLRATKVLAELIAHGMQSVHSELRSTTPWGRVHGEWNISLQQGAELAEIAANPFMLLDYTSGKGNLLLPAALLQLPDLGELLQAALENGLLQKRQQALSLEVQLEQGELTLNGRVIPL